MKARALKKKWVMPWQNYNYPKSRSEAFCISFQSLARNLRNIEMVSPKLKHQRSAGVRAKREIDST
jgi:hypothetical protein